MNDPYKTLGVAKNAGPADIQKAFRKLARRYHPDSHPGDTQAEARFKEISEAYEVLSNPEKRKVYDQQAAFGFAGGRSGAGRGFDPRDFSRASQGGAGFSGNFSDLFSDLFKGESAGGDPRKQYGGPARGHDLTVSITVSFKDALSGLTTKIAVDKNETCSTCKGSGARPGTKPVICPTCKGRGIVAQNQGFFSLSETCSRCGGNGTIIESPCLSCGGSGMARRTKKYTVKIPPGVRAGSRIRLKGKGEAGTPGSPPGDLFIVTHVAPHPLFTWHGDNLLIEVPITFSEAALGATIDVPTPHGKTVQLRVAPGTGDGKLLRLSGQGAPRLGRTDPGDLLVKLRLTVPSTLTKTQEEALRRFAKVEGPNPREAILNAL